MDAITKAVQQHYNAFPFPAPPVTHALEPFRESMSFVLGQYLRTRQLQDPTGKRALIVGCGTGVDLYQVAQINPGLSEIIGIDISSASLDLASQRIQHHQLRQCHVQSGDVMDPQTLPEGSFDLIIAYDVLPYTADPIKALHHLVSHLAPEGVLLFMVHNRLGRMIIDSIRVALKHLGRTEDPTPENLQFVRDLLANAEPQTLLARRSDLKDQPDAQLAHLVFTPQIHTHDLADLPPWLDQVGLQFLGIVPSSYLNWNPEMVINPINRSFYEKYDQLTRWQQLQLLEWLAPLRQPHMILWCCHQGASTVEWTFDRDWFKQSYWQLNPLVLKYAKIQHLDQAYVFKDVIEGKDALTARQLYLKWPLFRNQPGSSDISRFQLKDLLGPIATQALPGKQLLDSMDPEEQSHGIQLFQEWEAHRVVLRAIPNHQE